MERRGGCSGRVPLARLVGRLGRSGRQAEFQLCAMLASLRTPLEFCLAVEQEVADVAILHHVLFALDTQLASSPDFLFAGERFEIFE